MDEAERLLFTDLLSSLDELKLFLKCNIKEESAKDLKFLYTKDLAIILHKNSNDVRKLMKSKRLSSSSRRQRRFKSRRKSFY